MDIEKIIASAAEQGVSDVHLVSGLAPQFRVSGDLVVQGEEVVTPQFIQALLEKALTDEQKKTFGAKKQVDFILKSSSNVRLRGNAFMTRNGMSIALRLINSEIRELNTLGFPEFMLEKIRTLKTGLVLVVGATGQGKSSTMAAILQELARIRPQHLITIEDPIEYLLPSSQTVVQQREVGRDVVDFSAGLRAALREDPDTLMVGEMRDYETISSVLTMAETGHVVFSTLHTNSGPQTISRIIDVFPADQQPQIRSQLADSLSMIIAQRLVKKLDGGMTIAYEILTNNYAIKTYIRDDKVFQIPNAMQTDSSGTMVQLGQSLAGLVINGIISKEEALNNANDKEQLLSILEREGM